MPEWGYCRLWYHGSPVKLDRLPAGSTVTQVRNLARAFAHQPTLVSLGESGKVRHNGIEAGYIYCISEEVRPKDVRPLAITGLSGADAKESQAWITERSLRIKLISREKPDPEEQLTEEEAYQLKKERSRPQDHDRLAN